MSVTCPSIPAFPTAPVVISQDSSGLSHGIDMLSPRSLFQRFQDYAHSEDYPLRRYGREAGIES